MNLLPGLAWLTSMATRRTRVEGTASPDLADMGTAFGLDASMAGNAAAEPPPGRANLDAPATAPPRADRVVRRPRR